MEIALKFSSPQSGSLGSSVDKLREHLQQLGDTPVSRICVTFDSNDRAALLQAAEFFESASAYDSAAVAVFIIAQPGVQAIDEVLALHHILRGKFKNTRTDIVLSDQCDGFAYHANPSNALHTALNFYRQLHAKGVGCRWLIPLSPVLVFQLEGLVSVAREESVDLLLVPADVINDGLPTLSDLTADQRLFAWDFVTYRLLQEESHYLSSGQHNYYQLLIELLTNGDDVVSTAQLVSLTLSAPDSWQSQTRQLSSAPIRDAALAPHSAGVETNSRWQSIAAMAQDLMDVAWVGGRGHLRRSLLRASRGVDLQGRSLKKILLIGAYGGEHIGDAAILGGVLLRMHRLFGSAEAVLMTQRLAHTRHLIPMLEVPVSVEVDIYECEQIRRHVEWCDAVVFAGGPLIDLPKQLVRHIYTVSLARSAGKPFIAEGIGPGPFARLPSKFTAERLMDMADRITLRAADAADHELVRDRQFEVGLCPAFDYLETRGTTLTRMPPHESAEIEALLAGTEGRPIIGINIRPIGYLYTYGAPDDDVAGYTRRTEALFEDRLVEGLRRYQETSGKNPCFVFFPMNAIQFGMSDLRSAYRIQQRLGGDVDFRVWQADASLDGVLALIRRLDVAITMRFHAAIFALSQHCKVIGIDYRIGKKDKVAGLLDDVGQGEHCARIDLLEGEWLANKLEELL